MEPSSQEFISDNWENLKAFTAARIAIGRTGVSVPTHEFLQFQLSHARARDAVHKQFYREAIFRYLQDKSLQPILLETRATDRNLYLKNPDLGRRLGEESRDLLKSLNSQPNDLGILIGDGLSSRSVEENTIPYLQELLAIVPNNWKIAPIPIVQGARVALGDEVGEILKSQILVFLIGERPGLSSPNSMGIYITFQPKLGRKDSERNCISNVRPEGLSYIEAAQKTLYILKKAQELGQTGVLLQDDMELILPHSNQVPEI